MHTRLRLLLLASVLFALLVPAVARATEYEIYIDIDDEEELYDLYITDQISEDTFNTLVELRRRGVDLNEADREVLYSLPNLTYDDVDAILAYRAEVGVINAPGDLAAAGVLSREKLGSILTFIQAYDKTAKLTATHGWVRYQAAWSQEDRTIPPMVLQARVTTLRQLTVGVAGFVTRQRPGNPVWDPNRESMIAAEMAPRVNVPKYFVQWDTSQFGVIAGTYRIGFGQRLTFDNTDRYTPNGFVMDDAVYRNTDLGRICRESGGELPQTPCPGGADNEIYYGTKDFRWRDSLRGVAIGAKHLSMPVGWVQLYGFGSWQTKQIYQYQVLDADQCEDPLSSDDSCSAPAVLVSREGQSRFDPLAAHRTQTLPNMYDEFLGGGNFTWFYDRRTHVGLTGYAATASWRVDGANLDFQEWSPTPFGGTWGAIGADAAWGYRWSDLGVELSRSFDSMTSSLDPEYGGGGFAGIVRHTATFGSHELELSARYYDKGYANPYAGPISQADKFHGNRARDEAGGRVRYGGRIANRLDLRGVADVWVQPRQQSPKLLTYLRGDMDVNDWFRPGLWLQYRNVDLRPGPRNKVGCVDDGSDEIDQNPANEDGSPDYRSGCLAEVGQITGRMGFKLFKGKLSITAQYQHEFIDDPSLLRKEQGDLCEDDPTSPYCQPKACIDDLDPDDPMSVPDACSQSCGGDGQPACYNVCTDNPDHPLCVSSCADDPTSLSCHTRLRQDSAATLIVRAQPLPGFRVTGRLRYLFEDIANNNYYEQSLWTYFDLSYVIRRVFLIRARYDVLLWMDNRASTMSRVPNPEHRLRLELEARF
ncbi:hypothetical protein DB30_00583 [Enhygromyxa salina]|uniref:Helix-hairpin-helix motif protein n=1 Tax=Enhygromyxa salina TaxID=215803 RepID=A0A0C1ZQ49_9BACT|nr:hypothetical protein [Enhygromyxa salina]KIG13118.1 hypothetical protein DB30_00583 [Enhygromyxa salina]